MADLMTPQYLLDGFAKIASVNPVFTGKELSIYIIANEKAGGFTQTKQSEKNKETLDSILAKIADKQPVTASVSAVLLGTEKSGHGEELAKEIAAKTKPENENQLTMIVSAGGDGTSLEVQTGLTKFASESEENKKTVQNNIVIFRLPLGTGNDGTDGHTFEESLNVLTMSLHFANARAIRVSTSGEVTEKGIAEAGKNPADYGNAEKAPWYAFNISSLGLSAFVCWKTNAEKAKHPGNHYSLMVDFAALNYNKAFPPEPATIKLYDGDELKDTLETAFEMLCLGVSGHRSFGGGKKIFPVDDNVACIRKLDVMTMVMQNKKFNDGSYISTNLAKTLQATKIVVEYEHPVLVELDGETHLLLKENFPVTMELTEPCIQVLESDNLEWSRGTVRK